MNYGIGRRPMPNRVMIRMRHLKRAVSWFGYLHMNAAHVDMSSYLIALHDGPSMKGRDDHQELMDLARTTRFKLVRDILSTSAC